MDVDGGGEGAEAGVSRSEATAEALPSPSPSPPSKRTRVAAPVATQAQAQAQAQGQGQEQASADRALVATTTTTSMRGRSRAAVVSSRELMERVLVFVAGGSRQARKDVGRAASVCRVWREAAYGEEVWGRMASEVMPVLGAGAGERDGRGYVVEVGRCLMERRMRLAEDWWEGLRLHLEVWDGRDGLRMLSAEGRLGFTTEPQAHANVRVTGSDRREVAGPAFSAASRDPEHHRFESVKDCFHHAHEEGIPALLRTRAVVRDVRSGRRALLWESGKGHRWGFNALVPQDIDPAAGFLPEGSFAISAHNDLCTAIVHPSCGNQAVQMWLNLVVRPEAGKEGMPDRDKMYRLAGADVEHYGEHDSFAMVVTEFRDHKAFGRFIWSLLSL
jgi:hypothetical protein